MRVFGQNPEIGFWTAVWGAFASENKVDISTGCIAIEESVKTQFSQNTDCPYQAADTNVLLKFHVSRCSSFGWALMNQVVSHSVSQSGTPLYSCGFALYCLLYYIMFYTKCVYVYIYFCCLSRLDRSIGRKYRIHK